MMAMTKKELAEMDALKTALRIAKSFRFTSEVAPDLRPPKDHSLTKGWLFNDYSHDVFKACSSSVHHGNGWERTSAQNPRSLYSTELLAYRALRYAMEVKLSAALARVDARIEALGAP